MRKPHLTTLAMAFLAASSLASTAQAGDLTLVQTSSAEAAARPATEYTTTFLIHGVRSRALSQSMREDRDGHRSFGPHIALIQQCDLRRTVTLDLDNRIYSVHPLPAKWTKERFEAAKARAAAEQQRDVQPEQTLTIRTEVTDTGERRDAFGRALRHYRIQTETIPGAKVTARQARRSQMAGTWRFPNTSSSMAARWFRPRVPVVRPIPLATATSARKSARALGS